jgi:CshA-type fibril repeat protein
VVGNQPPNVKNDLTYTHQNEPVTFNIGTNDKDVDGSIVGFDLNPNQDDIQNTATTSQGTFSVDNSGNLVFTPVSGFLGTATLPYQAIDDDGASSTATINIVVGNQPPIANNDTKVTGQNEPVTLNILNNDNDPDGNIIGIDLDPEKEGNQNQVTTPQGIFSVDPSGNLTFTPASDFTGTATLPYTIFDNDGDSDSANINIVVTEEPAVNIPPEANDDTKVTGQNEPVTLNILNNDSDSDGSITAIDLDPNTPGLQNTYSDGQGIFSVDNDGNLIFTPNSTFTGVATLNYQVIDNDGETSNTANINITVTETPEPPIVTPEIPAEPEPEINKPPIANDDNTTVIGDQPVTLNILVNDNDPDGSITAVDLNPDTPGIQNQVTTPQGTFSLDNNGNLVFNPTNSFTGVATLSYQIFDNDGATDQAIIRININPEDIPAQPEVECDCRCPEVPVLDQQPELKPAPALVLPSPNPFTVNIDGTENNDNLIGGDANEQFLAENGDDVIDGQAGNDNIFGGFGNDFIQGGIGADYLNGKEDNDTIHGGDDNDFIHGGKQNDLVYGELGDDTIIGEQGEDTLWGGTLDNLDQLGKDVIAGGEGNDLIYGNQANDTLIGEAGDDWLRGGKDEDLMYGESGNDTLMGELGNDTLIGDPDLSPTATDFGADALYGEEGDDILAGGRLNDTLLGGKDNDWIYGGKDNDWIKGELGNDTLFGQQGDDTLLGGNNDATVLDLEGKDLLFGAGGNDMINGFYANDTLMGGKDEDQLFGGKGDDIIFGELGNDLNLGDDGNDTICAGDGDDTIYGDNIGASEAVGANGQQDKLGGGAGNDRIFGNEGQDMLCGDEGNDTLRGGKDNDMLCGGDGDDWLMGEQGDDTIVSGLGNDLIGLELDGATNMIADLQIGSDRLVLPDGVSFNDLTFSQSGNGTLITYQGQNIVLLNNINPDNLSASLFESQS